MRLGTGVQWILLLIRHTLTSKLHRMLLVHATHLRSSSATAASKKRGSHPATASVRVTQRPKHANAPKAAGKVAKWFGTNESDFICDMDGSLAEPLPGFFTKWIASCPKSELTDKPMLPDPLLRTDKLAPATIKTARSMDIGGTTGPSLLQI